jgi:thiamine kinase-like enzyme
MNDTILKNILKQLNALTPRSREELLKDVSLILSSYLVEVRDRHNTSSVIFIFNTPSDKYLLKAEYGNENATTKEVQWYSSAHSQIIAPPLIGSLVKADYSYLLLPYIKDASTLDDLVESKLISSEELFGYVTKAINMDRQLLNVSKPRRARRDEVEFFYLKKYQKRAKESQRFSYLNKLLNAPRHRINNKVFNSPIYYLTKVAEDSKLHTYLTPNLVGMVHGDLHCGNILVKNESMYCIDPNGSLSMPIEYDYGKMLHSIHGGYHQIMRGQYTLEILDDEFYFKVEVPDIYSSILKKLQAQLTEQEYLRAIYAEAVHFATLLPHHATKQAETTALFLRCIYLFEEMFYYMGIK